jgi:hypothetical protein
MGAIELACGCILALYVAVSGRTRAALARALAILGGAWLAEDTCIRAYGFYQYAPGWHLWIDRVPAMIVLIWPAVVLSARSVVVGVFGARSPAPRDVALWTGLLVTFDAALIEPIAVQAGLWSWNEPGIFCVPPVGILGWGLFAAAITWAEEALPGVVSRASFAAVATHVGLLAAWWGALRWVSGSLPPGATIAAVAAVSMSLAVLAAQMRASVRRGELFVRGVATLFFAGLLVRGWSWPLAAYAAAFTLPHLVLCVRSVAPRRALAP